MNVLQILTVFIYLFIYDILGDDKPREDKELGHEVPCIAKASFLVN